ncbi:MAG: serine hydrolase domain-containing protein [Candidatus Hodarchaeota archaeon]
MTLNCNVKNQLQAFLDQIVCETDNIHNAVMLIEISDFKWKGASGMMNPGEELVMDVNDQFFTASVAKMMTATLALKLMELGKIQLDDQIHNYLPRSVIEGLHNYEGQVYGETITIRQCLNHTTGLGDNWHDNRFMQLILEEPNKFWEPEETIEFVKQNIPPHFPPGQGFSYSDINYNLIGLILENVSGKTLQALYRDLLLDPLGMNHTYRQFREDPRPSIAGRGPSHTYYGDIDYTSWKALSADWAGGGLQSTTEDLNRFLRAFVRNEVFIKPATREEMFKWVKVEEDTFYGLGLVRGIFEENELVEIWGHIGASSCFLFYWPGRDATFCGTFNQVECEGKFSEILPDIIEIIK